MLQMMRMEYHNPVLLKESVNGLNIKDGEIMHSALLELMPTS